MKNIQTPVTTTGSIRPIIAPKMRFILNNENATAPSKANPIPNKRSNVIMSEALTYIPLLISISCIITAYFSGMMLSIMLDTGDNALGIAAIFPPYLIFYLLYK